MKGLVPFWLNIGAVLYAVILGRDCIGAIGALPFTLGISMYVFLDAVVFLNTKRGIVLSGTSFARAGFDEVDLALLQGNEMSELIIRGGKVGQLIVWASESVDELRRVEQFVNEVLGRGDRSDEPGS